MEQSGFDKAMRELEDITRELDEVQKEMTRDIAEKIDSIQRMIDQLPEGGQAAQRPPRELILEKARIIMREDGKTFFEGLY